MALQRQGKGKGRDPSGRAIDMPNQGSKSQQCSFSDRLLDEIIRVARHLGTPADTISELESAKVETQFSKAVENVKTAIPEVLYIKGHNPLILLHSALSEGLHEASDEVCLMAASDIRLLLFAFAERLTEAMTDQKELNEALGRLVNRKR